MSRGGSTRQWRKLRLYVAARDGLVCRRPLCECGGAELTLERRQPNSFTLGHIVPVIHGGTDHPENLRPECARENYREGSELSRTPALNTSREW